MFSGRVAAADARALSYEVEGMGSAPKAEGEMAISVEFLRSIEPYRAHIPFGQVRLFQIPATAEYVHRTGIARILAVAVHPLTARLPGAPSPQANLSSPIADALDSARRSGVRFLAMPFLGARPGDGVDVDVYEVLLQAAVDAAANPGSLRALYVGAYGDAPPRQKELATALNTAWQRQRRKLLSGQQELVDAGWRLTSITSLFAILYMVKRQYRVTDAKAAAKLGVAVVLLAKGISEVVLPVARLAIVNETSPILLILTLALAGAILGWFLPSAVLFDPKKILESVEPQEALRQGGAE